MFVIIYFIILFFHFLTSTHAHTHKATVLSVKKMSLDDRYPVKSVNEVFKENILLTLAYLKRKNASKLVTVQSNDKPVHYELTLHKGQVFAFHDAVLPQYKGKVVATTNAHFDYQEGFKSDGYLTGDGVCHFASLIDYAAKTAGLSVFAPTSHDFAAIPDVPKQFGVAIYTTPTNSAQSAEQNLYVTNSLSQDVKIMFDYHNSVLEVSVIKSSS